MLSLVLIRLYLLSLLLLFGCDWLDYHIQNSPTNPSENKRPRNPGALSSLSKQGLEAIIGNKQNRIPGECMKKKSNSLSILKSD